MLPGCGDSASSERGDRGQARLRHHSVELAEVVSEKPVEVPELRMDRVHVLIGKGAGRDGRTGVGGVHHADDGGERRIQTYPVVQPDGVGLVTGKYEDRLHLGQCIAERAAGLRRVRMAVCLEA